MLKVLILHHPLSSSSPPTIYSTWNSYTITHIILANITEVIAYLCTITGMIWYIDRYYPIVFTIPSFPIYQMYHTTPLTTNTTATATNTSSSTSSIYPKPLLPRNVSLQCLMTYYLSILFPESFKLILIALLMFQEEDTATHNTILLLLCFHGLLCSVQICSLQSITNVSWGSVVGLWSVAMCIRCIVKTFLIFYSNNFVFLIFLFL